jgi:putative inorganic carbon (HCO3(-)) transporter
MTAIPQKNFILSGIAAIATAFVLFHWFNFLLTPFFIGACLLALAIIFSFYDYHPVFKLMIFSLPLSINFHLFAETSVIFPSELVVGILTLIFVFRLFFSKTILFDRAFLNHPITILVILYFAGLFLSSFFSTMPIVSFKSVTVRASYILVFYFMMHSFIKRQTNYLMIFFLYGSSLLFVIIYAISNHVELGLIKNYSAQSVSLFYNDHTMYSAAIAFVIPSFVAAAIFPKLFSFRKLSWLLLTAITFLFFAGLYLSFCRAAWISIMVALIVLFLILMRTGFMMFVFLVLGIVVYTLFNYDELKSSFRQNKIDSNVKNAGFYEQTGSITNITSDVSNAERLNRWSCAIRMFKDKPLTGFGSGTYQFQYLPYQRKKEMTRISVTSPYNIQQGHGGSTHSEYLLALSESGIFSMLFFTGLFFLSLHTALRLSKNENKKTRIVSIVVLLGLITYFTHGLFNNFLDNDKLAFLFWSSLSVLCTLDISSIAKQPHER